MTLRIHPDEIVERSTSGLLAKHPSWERVRLGEVADVVNGFAFRSEHFSKSEGVPLLRIRDVGKAGTEVRYHGDFNPAHLIRSGDLVVGMDGDFRADRWSGPDALLNQRVCKVDVRDPDVFDPSFLLYVLPGYLDEVNAHTSSVTVKHLSSRTVAQLPLPLPPMREQRRIVAAIEEEFSRLDAAVKSVSAAATRRRALERSLLAELTLRLPGSWPVRSVEDVGRVQLGRQRSPKKHIGPGMRPYLRVANVFEDRLDLSDVKEMSFSDAEFERYELRPGDILLNEGQSPHLVGRPAIYRGELPGACFTNSLIRFQAGPDVEPEFALLVFRSHLHSGRFQREARITTNIAHMAAGRFKRVEFPLPSLREQRRVVAAVQEKLSHLRTLHETFQATELRASALRRSILERAFRGELVPQDPSDEPASVLLDRIRAERAAADRPRRRASRRSA